MTAEGIYRGNTLKLASAHEFLKECIQHHTASCIGIDVGMCHRDVQKMIGVGCADYHQGHFSGVPGDIIAKAKHHFPVDTDNAHCYL